MQSDQGNNNIHYRISIKYPYTSCCTMKKIQYNYLNKKIAMFMNSRYHQIVTIIQINSHDSQVEYLCPNLTHVLLCIVEIYISLL